MRPPFAFALIASGALVGSLALAGPADARKHSRTYQPRYYAPYYARPYYPQRGRYYGPSRGNNSYSRQVCEERAEAADPSGQYAGYPCWAREAFSPRGRR